MQEHLVGYFNTEKSESIIFVVIAVVAILASGYLLKTDNSYKGMAYPLIGIALIQLVVGGTILFRTDNQIKQLSEQLANDRDVYKTEELGRMAVVVKNFKIYKAIEITLLAAGILMTFFFVHNQILYAAGIGLILQSSIMLVLDLFAEKRADEYIRFIQELL